MDAVQNPVIPLVGQLIQQHPGTISLGQGVVSYPPPPEAIAQISECLAHPHNHHYQSVQGIASLRAAIATKLKTENGIDPAAERAIVVTAGSNMGFLNAVLAITQPGDEIILQVPYYFNHEMAIAIAGCRAVLVPTTADYQLQLDAMAQAIGDRTRAIVTISPNNPTGAVYPAADLQAVNDLCRQHGIYHIHDEAYEYFTDEGVRHFSPGSLDASAAHTISLFSLSKAYGFASWRIGYMVIPEHLLLPVMKIQDTNVICPAVVAQYAALGALSAGRAYCQPYIDAIAQVRHSLFHELSAIADICTVPPTAGAFYFLLHIHSDLNPMALVTRLIQEHRVAVLPGDTFGMAGCYLRVAYGAIAAETALAGIERLATGLRAIVPPTH